MKIMKVCAKEVKFYIISLFSLLFISSCVSIKTRPVFLPSTPQSVYLKQEFISLGYSIQDSSEELWYDLTFQKSIKKIISHIGVTAYFYDAVLNDKDKTTSSGLFLFSKTWLTLPKRKYPFANFYVGLQPSFVFYKDVINEFYSEDEYYYPVAFDFGFCPGIYRENYNLSIVFRGGGGYVLPQGGWLHIGAGLQGNVFIKDIVGIGGNFEFVFGVGGKEDAALIAAAPILKVNLLVKLR